LTHATADRGSRPLSLGIPARLFSELTTQDARVVPKLYNQLLLGCTLALSIALMIEITVVIELTSKVSDAEWKVNQNQHAWSFPANGPNPRARHRRLRERRLGVNCSIAKRARRSLSINTPHHTIAPKTASATEVGL